MKDKKSKNARPTPIYVIGHLLRRLGEMLLFTAKTLGAMSVTVGILSGVFTALRAGLRGGVAFILLPILIITIGCVLCGVAAVTGSLLCRVGKKLTTKGAENLLLHDSRNPVLYLRSFKDDRLASAPVTGGQQVEVIYQPLTQAFTGDTEEEILASELNRVGPCVAVGIPGERLPPIGAARMYFEDSEWEENVLALMMRSELVIMRAGTTRGFLLELEMAVRNLDPRKLVILLPFEAAGEFTLGDMGDGYTKFREAANKVLPKELPPFSGKRLSGSSLSGLIHFQSDWTPKVLKLSEVGDTIKESFETITKRYSNYGVI
jgi:hypothetical protein